MRMEICSVCGKPYFAKRKRKWNTCSNKCWRKGWQRKHFKNKVEPYQAVWDFFAHFKPWKFKSKEDLETTVNNYSKAVCQIEGNCQKVREKILERVKAENYEAKIERQNQMLTTRIEYNNKGRIPLYRKRFFRERSL